MVHCFLWLLHYLQLLFSYKWLKPWDEHNEFPRPIMKRRLPTFILFYVTCKVNMLAFRSVKALQPMRLARTFLFLQSQYPQYLSLILDLVSTEWVYNRLEDVKILDTTRHISPHEDAKSEFELVWNGNLSQLVEASPWSSVPWLGDSLPEGTWKD